MDINKFIADVNRDYSKLEKLIPNDKFDLTPFPVLMVISEDKVKPILPKLLYCIADMNWPIASEMLKVLARFPDSIVPLIKTVLMPTVTDEEWKYFIIMDLIPMLPAPSQGLLFTDINRITVNPTNSEINGDVWEVAMEYVTKNECKNTPLV